MKPFGRREFIGGAAAVAAALESRELFAGEARPDVVEVSGSDRKAMVKAVFAAFGGVGAFVKKGDRVVLKPNIAFANPPAFATGTHPDTLVAVAEACLSAGAKEVLVLEYALDDSEKCLERCGVRAALKALPEVKVRMLADHGEFREVKIPDPLELQTAEIAKAALDADCLINLPQAKHHSTTGVSFGLKNAMGLIWSRKPFHVTVDIHKALADLGKVIKPSLTILDATRVMLDNGPRGPGTTAEPGKMIAGRAAASVDAFGLTVAKFGGKQMQVGDARHIVAAGRAGLGEFDVARMKVTRVAA